MSFAEAGLAPPSRPARPRAVRTSRLDATTLRLLNTIERVTGERPPFGETLEAPTVEEARKVRRRAAGWNEERTALAAEMLRSTDTGEATVQSLSRARAALVWDLLTGPRLADVDRALVESALARAEELLPRPVAVEHVVELEWPVDPVHVTSHFGVRADPFGDGARRHTGIDLAAVEGQHVRTAGPGTVLFAGHRGGYGLHVEIEHPGEIVTRYAHLSEIDVAEGARVDAGTVVGRAGKSGRATGPHLHFELWKAGLPTDPIDELPPVRSLGPQARR